MSHQKKRQFQSTLRNAFLRVRHRQSLCVEGRWWGEAEAGSLAYTFRARGVVLWKQQEAQGWSSGGLNWRPENSSPERGCVEKELLLARTPTVCRQADTEGPLPNFYLTLASDFSSGSHEHFCPIVLLQFFILQGPAQFLLSLRSILWSGKSYEPVSLSELRESPREM